MVRITPLQADPVTGFLIGRGFPTPVARRYAAGCVIRVVLGNESSAPGVAYDLRSWRARRPDGALAPLPTREEWLGQWRAAGLSETSLMGFEWSQLPTRQELGVGDFTQGMLNTGLPAGTRFDLVLQWAAGGRTHQLSAKGIDCESPS